MIDRTARYMEKMSNSTKLAIVGAATVMSLFAATKALAEKLWIGETRDACGNFVIVESDRRPPRWIDGCYEKGAIVHLYERSRDELMFRPPCPPPYNPYARRGLPPCRDWYDHRYEERRPYR